MAGLLEPAAHESRNRRFGNPLVVCFFLPFLTGRKRCILDKAAQDRDVPKSRIIAMGSTGAIGERPTSIDQISSGQARIARPRWEGTMLKLPRRQFLHLAVGAAALPAVSRFAWAQTYPARPVQIIVGYPPGGATDAIARLIAQQLSERLGQQFMVDNRPGPGSNIGTEAVVRSQPDGYTLLLIFSANAINATFYDKLSFNFIRDIAPVASIARSPFVMEVHPSVPAKTVPEFIAYAKANPGTIRMASNGNGTTAHVAGELFKLMTGVEMVHVPYRGPEPALTDLLAGKVQVRFGIPLESIEYIRAGKLPVLAVTTAARSEVLPDIPTVGEFVPGYEASAFFGLGAPKETPVEIVDKLNREINAVLSDPRIRARLAEVGGTVLAGTPAEFSKLIADETEKWAKVIREAKIKAG
jgi:tripartite-type tricarboxylate transporter receptor subunit TctC